MIDRALVDSDAAAYASSSFARSVDALESESNRGRIVACPGDRACSIRDPSKKRSATYRKIT